MAGTTSHYGFPYDTGTDQVPTFPTRLKNLADAIDTQLFNGLANKSTYVRQATAPTDAYNTFWEDTSVSPSVVKIWNGSAWVSFSAVGRATYNATTGSPTITTVSGKTCIKWTGSGSITIDKAGFVRALIVGGGGGSGGGYGSGGGAGGYVAVTDLYLAVGTHEVLVGAGGATGASGGNSRLGLQFAIGGGGGAGVSGGSGSGGDPGSGSNQPGGSGITGQGNAGGRGTYGGGGNASGGGGGGSSAAGTLAVLGAKAAGGAGTANDITGSSVTYAAGGAGTYLASGGGVNGAANTGDGGSAATASGGSGVVIILIG